MEKGQKVDFEERLKKEIKRIETLKTQQGKSEVELLKVLLFREWKREEKIQTNYYESLDWLNNVFINYPDVLTWLNDNFMDYQADFKFNESSDKQQLLQILYHLGQKKVIISESMNEKGKPFNLHDKIIDHDEAIMKLQDSLSINKKQRVKDKKIQSADKVVQDVLEKCEKYKNEHKEEFTWRCSCGQMNLLDQPHWAFDDVDKGTVWSQEGWELYFPDKNISLKYLATILRTSPLSILKTAVKKKFISEDELEYCLDESEDSKTEN